MDYLVYLGSFEFQKIMIEAATLRITLNIENHFKHRFKIQFSTEFCMDKQMAIFDPVGLPGILYWYGIYPLHSLVFRGMISGIVQACMDEVKGT